MSDVRLLLWLRARHMRTNVVRALHVAGTDFALDRDLGERTYQLYILAIFAAFFVLMWFWLLDTVEGAFVLLGPAGAAGVFLVVMLLPVDIFAISAFKGLRASWLKLSHPDIMYVAATALSSGALVGVSLAVGLLAGGVVAALCGYVVAVGMGAAMGSFVSPWVLALVAALLVMAALATSRLVGTARLVLARGRHRWMFVGALGLAALAIVLVGGVCTLVATPLVLAGAGFVVPMCVVAGVLIGADVVALALLAPRIDLVRVVEESTLYADMQPFGVFSTLDAATVGDYRRRCKMARRGPWFRLPNTVGPTVLVARSALSLVRQYEGLLNLLILGAGIMPFGVSALFGMFGSVGLMFWLMMLVGFSQSAREVTRVFRDDMRVRLVRDQLPYTTLVLLVLDALPAFVLVTLLSCLVVPFVLPAGASVMIAIALAILLNAAVVLSFGLDAVRLRPRGPQPWGEGGLFAVVVACGLVSFAGDPLLTAATALVACAMLVRIMYRGVERAR